MTIFKPFSDEQVREQFSTNFSFIVGESRPKMKGGKGKNDESITPEMWFTEFSWINCFMFCQAFHEGSARGIFSPAEIAQAEELIAMMP